MCVSKIKTKIDQPKFAKIAKKLEKDSGSKGGVSAYLVHGDGAPLVAIVDPNLYFAFTFLVHAIAEEAMNPANLLVDYLEQKNMVGATEINIAMALLAFLKEEGISGTDDFSGIGHWFSNLAKKGIGNELQ